MLLTWNEIYLHAIPLVVLPSLLTMTNTNLKYINEEIGRSKRKWQSKDGQLMLTRFQADISELKANDWVFCTALQVYSDIQLVFGRSSVQVLQYWTNVLVKFTLHHTQSSQGHLPFYRNTNYYNFLNKFISGFGLCRRVFVFKCSKGWQLFFQNKSYNNKMFQSGNVSNTNSQRRVLHNILHW